MTKTKIKRSQKKKQAKRKEGLKDRLYEYLKDYGNPEGIQEASEADTDKQLLCITTHVSDVIARNDTGTIVDVGCGKGILLKRAAALHGFKEKEGWDYLGTDFEHLVKHVLYLSVECDVHKKVDTVPLAAFYSEWPRTETRQGPQVVIIRNVFHELGITKTAQLITHVRASIQPEDKVIIQDLSVFPKAERGNVCWLPGLFEELLGECGFDTSLTEDRSDSGNRWFTVIASTRSDVQLRYEEVEGKVTDFRDRQLALWKDFGALHPEDPKFRDVQFAKIDFDLQFAALTFQLQDSGRAVSPLTRNQEILVHKETFEKCLRQFVVRESAGAEGFVEVDKHFRDRRDSLNGLVEFMTSESKVTIVSGPPLMGKTELLKHFLYGEGLHDRVPVFADIQPTASVWNVLDMLFSGMGCRIPGEVLQNLREVSFSHVRDTLRDFFFSNCRRVVIVFDHCENLIDTSGKIFDSELQELLRLLSEPEGAKMVMTARRDDFDLSFIPESFHHPQPQPPVGRFPKGEHVENVLQSFLLLAQYPAELIDAIDRHPLLTYLAGIYLQRHGQKAVEDEEFLADVRLKMRDVIFSRVIDEESRLAVEAMSRLRVPAPRKMVVELSSEESVSAAEHLGVIRAAWGGRNDLIGCIGALRVVPPEYSNTGIADYAEGASQNEKKSVERQFHEKIADCYERLYSEDNDPIWLRELHFHRMITGDKDSFRKFGVLYRSEVFSAGEYWYDNEKDFRKARWAYELVFRLGQAGYYVRMRIASCKVRLGSEKKHLLEEGEREFEALLKQYPREYGIKTAFVDARLSIKDYSGAAKLLNDFGFSFRDGWWIAGQFGRAYSGLHQHEKAIDAFEYQLWEKPEARVYEQIARAYHRLGDTQKESEKIQQGLRRYPNNKRLRVCRGALLERTGNPEEAVKILEPIFGEDPTNGWLLFPLLRAMGRADQLGKAVEIWEANRHRIRQDLLKTPIEAEILARQGKFERALSVLRRATDDEHKVGQTLEIYLAWADSQADEEESRQIASTGLSVPIQPNIQRNVPVLIMRCRLALVARDRKCYDEAMGAIKTINPSLPELKRIEEEYRAIWADQNVGP